MSAFHLTKHFPFLLLLLDLYRVYLFPGTVKLFFQKTKTDTQPILTPGQPCEPDGVDKFRKILKCTSIVLYVTPGQPHQPGCMDQFRKRSTESTSR